MGSSNHAAPETASSANSSSQCLCPYLWGGCHQFQQEKLNSQFHRLGDASDDDPDRYLETSTITDSTSTTTVQRSHSARGRWRDAISKLMKECWRSTYRGKKMSIHCCCYSSRPINNFGYDAASYFKNFDDGCTGNDDHYVPLAAARVTVQTNLKAAC